MPVGQDVVVTNTELEGERVVSTSFHVSMDGMVNKTQRLLLRIKDSRMAKIKSSPSCKNHGLESHLENLEVQ